ncbi:zinc ribbon domain-containing protein [Acinetobacter pittii]|uniref:zinc ribbon domain-containing protein n=1 Tax=Acinetobacter pittii TaxID=48296 RepID=UPI0005C6B978|nr:zinc ribbon domain-containing protein [Acinetobacter pittii]
MAIKPCKECGAPVSDKADACPRCGAKVKKMGLILKIILWFLGISFVIGIIGSSINDKKSASNKNAVTVQENSSNNSQENKEPNNWLYSTSKDELHETNTKFAATASVNEVNFDFPYNGGSNLLLSIRKNHAGTDVYITVTKGQFLCGLIDGCEVAFKFDDGKIMNITMVEPDSHASDVLFVKLDSTEAKIIEKIKTSKKLIIAPKFFQYGDVPFTFDVSNYKDI